MMMSKHKISPSNLLWHKCGFCVAFLLVIVLAFFEYWIFSLVEQEQRMDRLDFFSTFHQLYLGVIWGIHIWPSKREMVDRSTNKRKQQKKQQRNKRLKRQTNRQTDVCVVCVRGSCYCCVFFVLLLFVFAFVFLFPNQPVYRCMYGWMCVRVCVGLCCCLFLCSKNWVVLELSEQQHERMDEKRSEILLDMCENVWKTKNSKHFLE